MLRGCGSAVPDPSISLVPPKKIKDPNAPKRPLSAFLEYVRHSLCVSVSLSLPLSALSACLQAAIRRPDILKENPGIAFGAVGKLMGEEWRAMPEDIKAPYVAKAEAAKAQYDKDKAAYGESLRSEMLLYDQRAATLPRNSGHPVVPVTYAEATKW